MMIDPFRYLVWVGVAVGVGKWVASVGMMRSVIAGKRVIERGGDVALTRTAIPV